MRRGLRDHKAAQGVAVGHHPAAAHLRDQKGPLKMVLVLALAGGEAAGEARASTAGWLGGGAGAVPDQQSLQLLQKGRRKGASSRAQRAGCLCPSSSQPGPLGEVPTSTPEFSSRHSGSCSSHLLRVARLRNTVLHKGHG